MPISELGYRHWTGKRTGPFARAIAIARSEVAIAYKSSKLLRRVLILAWMPVLYFCPFFLAIGYVTDPKNALVEGALLTEIAEQVAFACSALTELNERKKAEENAKRLQVQLQQSQKMEAVGTLAGGVAHDMNNVLAVVLGLGSVLENEIEPDDPKLNDVREIVAAARRGKSMVENLLGFARKGNYRKELVSLTNAVRDLIAILSHSIPKTVVVNTALDSPWGTPFWTAMACSRSSTSTRYSSGAKVSSCINGRSAGTRAMVGSTK